MGCKNDKNQWSMSSAERGQSDDRSSASVREAETAKKAEGKISPPANLSRVLQGGNAPKQNIVRDALFKRRSPPQMMPNNAPATNYRANLPSNQQFTPEQEKLVTSLVDTKGEADARRRPTWLARLYG